MGARDRTCVVLAYDRETAEARWKAKGWTIARVSPGPHIEPKTARMILCVTLHLQRTKRGRRHA